MEKIRIGTRGSDLALWQAHFLQDQLKQVGYESSLTIIKTKGDKIQHLSFDKIEGKGFFTKEIEDSLLNDEVDVAVHSMKDLPTEQPAGLVLAGTSYRADPRDVLLVREETRDKDAPLTIGGNRIVGTSSARRKAQILHLDPGLTIKDIRGNVPTRIEKLKNGDFDAIILAGAGIERLDLDLSGLYVLKMNVKEFIPAPAQGILAFQCRGENIAMRKIIKKIHKSEISRCSNIERGLLNKMDGGCHSPLGIHCYQDVQGNFHSHVAYAVEVGKPLIHLTLSRSTSHGMVDTLHKMITEKIENYAS